MKSMILKVLDLYHNLFFVLSEQLRLFMSNVPFMDRMIYRYLCYKFKEYAMHNIEITHENEQGRLINS